MYLQGYLLHWGKGGEKSLFQKCLEFIYEKLVSAFLLAFKVNFNL